MSKDSDDEPLLDGKYRVVRELGAGGFGRVLLAVDEVLGARQVAIKVLREPDIEETELLAEMRTLAGLTHPGVVVFYHHFVYYGRLHLVMEYCPGGSLRPMLDQGPQPVHRAVEWAKEIAATLQIVHCHDIVHHDIKPENLLLTADKRLRIGDFGVANRLGGTRVYMAPELFPPAPGSRSDPRVDVYALGVTLLEFVTGKLPHWDKRGEELQGLKLTQEFIPRSLPVWLQDVLFRATHPTPELRFQNMKEFIEALESRYVPYIFNGSRIRAQGLAERAERSLRNKKWKRAEKCILQAFALSDTCVAAHLAAGHLALLLKRIPDAAIHLNEALRLNPRTHIHKELGWIAAEQGDYAKAISLMNDHVARNAADFEAYNLLLYCFYMTGRYEAGEDLARVVMGEKPPSDCFRNNRILCRLLAGIGTAEEIADTIIESADNPFVQYNYLIAIERPATWDPEGPVTLKSKLLFQDYRFGLRDAAAGKNTVIVQADGAERRFSSPIVSLGTNDLNDIILSDKSVSRRHCALINFPADVWVVDLNSTAGTSVDGEPLRGRKHLDGVHAIRVGKAEFRVSSREDLLL